MHPVVIIWVLFGVAFVWGLVTQLLVPAWGNDPFFPAFRKGAVKRAAKDELEEAENQLRKAMENYELARSHAGGDILSAKIAKDEAEEVEREARRKAKRLGIIIDQVKK